MPYDLPLYRPPSEGNNLIVQATIGCSFNRCSFCSMYKSKTFTARPLQDVFAHIEMLAGFRPDADRVFLADGDALTLPTETLVSIADKLAYELPNLRRISTYATPANILKKSEDELERLRARGISLVYLGVESGSPEVLRRITKGATADGIANAINKAMAAGIKVSATAILGIGGKRLSREHVEETAALINRAPPTYLSTLQLTLDADAIDNFMALWDHDFEPQDDIGVLVEMRGLLGGLAPTRPVIFRSNHASNCLPLAGVLPRDTKKLAGYVDDALAGTTALRPDWLRGL